MKLKNLIACFFLGFTSVSCIQDEALNSEAVIDACSGSEDVIMTDISIDTQAPKGSIDVYVNKGADLAKQPFEFKLSAGATISPQQKEYNFTTPIVFTVTSEDKKWAVPYTVEFIKKDLPTSYHFEDAQLSSNKKYHIFYEGNKKDLQYLKWASGNPGFNLTGMADAPQGFPTTQVDNGQRGKALKLETRSTGSFGAAAKMHIAAGNLFIGTFAVGSALTKPLEATRFGFPFYHKPIALNGFYKYAAGSVFTVKGEPQSGRKDKCDIYGVLYETDSSLRMLNGSNSLTHPNIVSMARIANQGEPNEWTPFKLLFELKPGKQIEREKLEAGKYNLAIVFSSSIDGAYFEGAVGSTLYMDEVVLEYE